MPDQVSFAKGSTKPTSGITTGRLYVVDSSTTDKSDLYLGKDATHLIQIGATVAQGAKADSSVQSVKVGSTSYSPSSGVVSLPAYPTTLPASDVYAWAKAATKPSYSFSEITSRGEAYLEWGGRQIQGGIGPLGMSISAEHSANRLALIPGAALTFEYSSDGGTTWTDYGFSDYNKTAFCTSSHSVSVGRPNSGTDLVANQSMTRITLTAQDGTTGYVYTDPRKMLVRVSSATTLTMLVETRTGTNYKSGGAWGKYGTYNVSGWSGWNDIPFILGTLGGGTTQTGNFWQLRLTFTCTTVNPSYPKTAEILAIRLYGTNAWTTPSTMANTGHLYTYDMNKNATFPAAVLATSFTEGGTTLSNKYLALTGGSMTGTLTVRAPIFGYEYNVSNNNAAFILDKPGTNYSGIGSHAETDTIYFGACSSTGAWVDSYKQKWKFNGTIIEDGTALSSKYGQLSAANTWAGVNTFNASDFYVTATNDVSISGNSGQNIISTDNGTDVIVGDTATGTTYIYGNVVDLNSSAVNIGSSSNGSVSINGATTVTGSISWASDPSNNNHLTRKSYVDNNFVNKTSNQTGIAGNKTWTGNQIVTGSVTHTISNATNYSTQYYDAQYRYNSGNLHSSASIQRSPNSVSTAASSNRAISSTGLSDNSSADIYISNGYTTSTTTMAAPRISFHTYSEGSASSSSPYVYHDGWVLLYSGNSNSNRYFSVNHELDASETQNTLKYDAEGRFSLDYDYMWGEETAHMEIVPQNGAFYIGDPYTYGIASIESIVNAAATCFRGDTSYITMADGSKKLIKDVEVGDIVKGYDVNKKEYTEAVVLQNAKTGEERAFDCYVMDDGTTVDIFNNDGFICSLDLHRKDKYGDKDGDYLNVYSMKSLYSFHEKKDDQRKIIKEEGNLENTTCVIHKFTADCAHRTARYSLYTSNGTFFVNGLLHGLSSRSLPQYFKTFKINTPDYIDSIFDSVLLSLAQRDESLPDTHIENPDKVADLATLNKAKATIAWAKDKLSKTDYKAMKYAEGALSEEEWLPIKEQRVEYRRIVNDNEIIVTEYTEKVAKDNPAVLDEIEVPEHIIRHDKWIKHQKIYDDNYELFKKWALSRKEEQQKRIEESKERSRLRAEEIKSNKSSQKNEDK